jgi:hypothetical protein
MSAIALSCIALACILAGALLGMVLRHMLPDGAGDSGAPTEGRWRVTI